jgi:hypothetical protein
VTISLDTAAERERVTHKPVVARFLWPVLGLVVPLGLAAVWEFTVRMGLSSGRLVPPPSVIFSTFADLAATGELQRHSIVTLMRVAAGFAFGVLFGTIAGAITGYSAHMSRLIDPSLQGLRAIPSIAWVPLFILWFGIFKLQDHSNRGRRVLPCLSGRDGCRTLGRSQNRRSRSRLSSVGTGDGLAHPSPGRHARLYNFIAAGPRPRLDVRGRG